MGHIFPAISAQLLGSEIHGGGAHPADSGDERQRAHGQYQLQ